MNVEWTIPAEADLDALFDFIGHDSIIYAEQFVDRILELVARLTEQPEMGRIVPEADASDVRELIFRKNFRIIYLLQDDCVRILAIVHAKQDLDRLRNAPWDVG